MFTPIDKSYSLWPMLSGLGFLGSALSVVVCIQMFLVQALDFRLPSPPPPFQVVRLTKPPRPVPTAARGHKENSEAAVQAADQDAQKPAASAVPGSSQWRRHVERGRGLDFEIVCEQSLPVLRAFGVSLAMDVRRPRGKTLLYNLQNGRLSYGVVPGDAVVREVEGLPAEFDGALREAERELGARPLVWGLYSADLYSAVRSLTEDALRQQGVPIDSVRTVRVRLSLAGGQAFAVRLITHS